MASQWRLSGFLLQQAPCGMCINLAKALNVTKAVFQAVPSLLLCPAQLPVQPPRFRDVREQVMLITESRTTGVFQP